MKRYILVIIATIMLASCASNQVGLEKHTGFTELPFPSNAFKSGQIVEIYSNPRKVEITFQSDIPWDQATTSEGWNISSAETSTIRATLATEISKILKGKYEFASTENIQVDFTNTKTTVVAKNTIYTAIKAGLKDNSDLVDLIATYMDDGTHFDVITTTLSANVSFTLVDASKNAVEIDSEVIQKLNSDFNIDFNQSDGSKKVISGSNLVIGIHTDPKLIRLLMKKHSK
ncbi:hypothetical protein [Shewanella frigidimarina]|uniref:hypothetical protein n=1 Tax=Shewanella frigidimarina TaxID=56812 RepID=UPI001404B24F|nr:hypothetical protein [Shewanella frigidimarina]